MKNISLGYWFIISLVVRICSIQWSVVAVDDNSTSTTTTIDVSSLFKESSSSQNHFGPKPRIVGGSDGEKGRFPYFVSLLNQYGKHTCGGVLVGPDVVLSAAHCAESVKYAQVGRWDQEDPLDDYEEFEILMPVHEHPLYNSETSFSHDAMLLKLSRQSTKQYIRINDDPNLPSSSSSTVKALGLGYTSYGDPGSYPQYLQEATLSYVPNNVCERARDPNVAEDYQGLISDDMLCASDNGQDACQGDSGGPLVIDGGSASNDLLVGIVSW
jgi:trypsin